MWIKISEDDGGIFALEGTPDPQKVVSVDELNAEIVELNSQLVIVNAEPDEILMPNDEKFHQLQMIEIQKLEIQDILIKLV